jgi:hypothetical protein
MSTAADLIPFYDYTLIERAVQTVFVNSGYFVAPPSEPAADAPAAQIAAWNARESWTPGDGLVAAMTDFEANIFQKPRPRVGIDFNNVAPVSMLAQAVVDARHIMRPTLYRGVLNFSVISDTNYTKHTQLRAMVAAYAMELAPFVSEGTNSSLGINSVLTYHYFNKLEDVGQDTSVHIEDGYYMSRLTFQATFQWRRALLPSD